LEAPCKHAGAFIIFIILCNSSLRHSLSHPAALYSIHAIARFFRLLTVLALHESVPLFQRAHREIKHMSTRFSTKDLSSPDDDAHDVDAIISQQPDAPIIVGSIGVEAQIAAAD